jgi:hypothetical protein
MGGKIVWMSSGLGEDRELVASRIYPQNAGGLSDDFIILPPRVKHSLKKTGNALLRQICIFPDDPKTMVLEDDYPGQTVKMFNPSEWTNQPPSERP